MGLLYTDTHLILLVKPEIGFYARTCRQPISAFSLIMFPQKKKNTILSKKENLTSLQLEAKEIERL